MNLESARLRLHEITWDDVEDIHALHSIPAVDEFNTLGLPQRVDDTREFMAPLIADQTCLPRARYCWTIHHERSDEFLGIGGMTAATVKFRSGEIYSKLLPAPWGQGYGTETARTMVAWGFSHLALHRIRAGVAVDNARSIHVLETIGMTREGRARRVLPIRGEWKDNYSYAIVEDDPRDY